VIGAGRKSAVLVGKYLLFMVDLSLAVAAAIRLLFLRVDALSGVLTGGLSVGTRLGVRFLGLTGGMSVGGNGFLGRDMVVFVLDGFSGLAAGRVVPGGFGVVEGRGAGSGRAFVWSRDL
jgi:hypothetical protein